MSLVVALGDRQVRAILLDIEGTTTPVEFVYEVLFPYARNHIKEFIRPHLSGDKIHADIAGLREEHATDMRQKLNPPVWEEGSQDSQLESIVTYVHWLMDRDRKSTALKSLQGKIWESGYLSGELRSQMFADVRPAFERWRRQKKDIGIFSSGSVLAQKLLFRHSTAGDLTGFIRGYFDTQIGRKTEADSYRRIAASLEAPASEFLFLSDATTELDAAQTAGMDTALCVRPGAAPPAGCSHRVVHTFDELGY